MSEIEQLLSKPKADVEAIAVQFGLFTPDEAKAKSSIELVSALSGVSVDELSGNTSVEKPVKKTRKSTTKTTSKTTKKTTKKKTSDDAPVEASVEIPVDESVSATDEDVKPSEDATSDKKPSKTRKTSTKKSTSKKKEETDVVDTSNKEEPSVVNESVVEEVKSTSKRSTKKKKTVEVTSEVTDENQTETDSTSDEKKPAKRGRKKKTLEAKSESEVVSSDAKPAEESSSEVATEEEKATKDKPSKTKGKKRRISFGPEQEIKQVEISPEEASAEENASSEETNQQPPQPEIQYIEIEGILSIGGDNKNDYCGFVHKNNYLPGEEDAYVPGQMIRRLGLRKGDHIKGLAIPPRGKEKYCPLRKVLAVNGIEIPEDSDFSEIKKRPRFESLTAVYPDERLTLETGSEDLSCRIIDLFSPIGKGQRGMIVSPPKAGKTILLKKVANAITANNPNCKVIVLLIDERPEEVTDMQRSINGEVVYSTFDKRPENHVRVTELVLERAMRLVEIGEDVVILLDSMTRLARAYNLTINPTGRTLSGGLDPGSLYGPKRFFGAARNIEFGGSLTIISTALIETGSRMDEVIFEEFKGTGNMEVVLDRKLADRRVYPAIAVEKSGTRREDLLLTAEELEAVWLTRKAIAEVDTISAAEAVINYMKRTNSNSSFVLSAKKSFSVDS